MSSPTGTNNWEEQPILSCDGGPTRWCSLLRVAKACHKETYCLALWQKTYFKIQENAKLHAVCNMSQIVLLSIQSLLLEPNSHDRDQKEMREILRIACDKGHLGSAFTSVCHDVAEKYYTEVVILLKHDVPPWSIAALLEHCQTNRSLLTTTRDERSSSFDQAPQFYSDFSPVVTTERVEPLFYSPQQPPLQGSADQQFCQMGPKQWCRSKEEARKCGRSAMVLCQHLFWRYWKGDQ